MPAQEQRYYTRDEVLAFPEDGNRYELVYGELLVSPAPRTPHQRVTGNVYHALRVFLDRYPGLGEAMMSPADVSWGREVDVAVQPDVFVIAPPDCGAIEWDQLRHFHLFVEVLSPATARYDRFTKRRLYQEMGVPLYWILDPQSERAEIWTPDSSSPVFEASRLMWAPQGASDPFTLELGVIWR